MPELSDDMYCSQQIMVPPMFPYILRQYAKAAIRSQPSDLLRWSTAYFRCLSLNLPPPVKPRLEYPVPKDYDGITPGWLKALLHQLISSSHVDFKVLWDRWIGACQNHQTLIKILCLGGFTDPMAVPLYRFIGLCVGFINENLTQTMIMFCEVITEEPEGGSSMIPVATFIDVYTFLAAIDAGHDQILLNRYFTDELLSLLEKKEEPKEEVKKQEVTIIKKEESIISEIIEEEQKIVVARRDTVSCPDLTEVVAAVASSEELDAVGDVSSVSTIIDDKDRLALATGKTPSQVEMERAQRHKHGAHVPHHIHEEMLGEGGEIASYEEVSIEGEQSLIEEPSSKHSTASLETSSQMESKASITSPKEELKDLGADDLGSQHASVEGSKTNLEDVAKDESITETVPDTKEIDEPHEHDIKKYLEAQSDIGEVPSTIGHGMKDEEEPTERTERTEPVEELSIGEPEEEGEEEASQMKYTIEEVFVERIPGIGPVVPTDLVEAVVGYMKKCAQEQHGMVMPRNIRHYSCPPLEA